MLVTPCPNCGKPTRAKLATPDAIHCDACGYAGPPSPEARASIEAARGHLRGRDVRARQISEAARRASLGWRTALLVVGFVIASIPTLGNVLWVLEHLAHPDKRQLDHAETWGAFGALLFGGLVGARLLEKHRRNQRAIRRALAAVPPLQAGAAATCRVCGADLAGGSAVVRCTFCGTDNYAKAAVIRGLDRHEANDVAAFKRDLDNETEAAAFAMSTERGSLLFGAFAVPICSFFLFTFGLAPLGKYVEGTFDDSARYSSALGIRGECIGRVITGKNGDYLLEQRYVDDDAAFGRTLPPAIAMKDLVGKRMAFGPLGNESGTLEAVYGSPVGNFARLTTGTGVARVDVRDLCYPGGIPETLAKDVRLFAKRGDALVLVNGESLEEATPAAAQRTSIGTSTAPIVNVAANAHSVYFLADKTLFEIGPNGSKPVRYADADVYLPTSMVAADDGAILLAGTDGLTFFEGPGAKGIAMKTPVPPVLFARGNDLFVAAPTIALFDRRTKLLHGLGFEKCGVVTADDTAVYCAVEARITAIDRTGGKSRDIFDLGYGHTVTAMTVDAEALFFTVVHPGKVSTIGRIARGKPAAHVVIAELPFTGPTLLGFGGALVTYTGGPQNTSPALVRFATTQLGAR